MRISESCVNSEDIKHDCNADDLFLHWQSGFGIMIVKDNDWIGYIDFNAIYQGDDIIISKIVLYDDDEKSHKLTRKYMSKILIFSHKDSVH